MVLYDIIDFNKTTLKIKKWTSRTAMQNAGSDWNNGMSTDPTISQDKSVVNSIVRENSENDAL